MVAYKIYIFRYNEYSTEMEDGECWNEENS